MIVKFYKNSSDNIVADKAITLISEKQCVLSGNNIKETPQIITEYDANIVNANYCYIADFGRYYFISPHELLSGGRVAFNCKTDLLKTCLSDVRASVGTATRTGNKQNNDITDNLVVRTGKITTTVRAFGEPLPTKEGGSFIMILAT